MRLAVATRNVLDTGPFREWCDRRLVSGSTGSEGLGGFAEQISVDDLAHDLGLDARRLYAWRFENKRLDQVDLEEALHHANLSIWDVYPELGEEDREPSSGYCRGCEEEAALDSAGACLWCGGVITEQRGPHAAGVNGMLRDRHFRALHKLHTDGGLTIRELSRRIWEQAGYASARSAEITIRRGFRRLGLLVINRRVILKPPDSRRCNGTNTAARPVGERCPRWAMQGEDYCWTHHPENRDAVREQWASLRPPQAVAA